MSSVSGAAAILAIGLRPYHFQNQDKYGEARGRGLNAGAVVNDFVVVIGCH